MSKQTLSTSNSMALEQPRGALGKISIVFATKLKSFTCTFLPVLKKLPTENIVKSPLEEGSSKLSEASEDHGAAEEKTMDDGSYKAEVVYISDQEPQEITNHSGSQQKGTTKSAIAPLPPPEEMGYTTPKPWSSTQDTANNKHPRTLQLGSHSTDAIVSSGLFLNSGSQREEEVLSPVSSVELFTSPFSSKESILSEGWEQETGWSALRMLQSPSGSISPCSSVRSGAFTPSVRRIKCHTLAPASSLMQMPLTSCQTLGCNKHITLPCPLSTRTRHRPPPTQLSLLTAILRKGRLPVLSSALQRPYSPCWPISQVNMSSCVACSAASNVAPMVGLQSKSCLSRCKTCTQPSCKARPTLPDITDKTRPVSPKDENKGSISPAVMETTDATDCISYADKSRIISFPEGRNSLTMSSYSPCEPPLSHTYQHPHKGVDLSRDSMAFSPESYLDSRIQANGHNSNETSPVIGNTKPCETSFSHLKLVQKSHKQPSIPEHKSSQQSQDILASASSKYTDVNLDSHLRNNRKIIQELEEIHSASPGLSSQNSPSPSVAGLTHLSSIYCGSPVLPSPRPNSCTSTSDRYTLSPSPSVPYHHLSPSPNYSLSSSPTPSLRDSQTPDSIDRGSKRPYKIKSTYKAIAAIPTNRLLLEQQAIDDEVSRNNTPLDPSDSFAWEDPHSQMYSPAELRQQSAELYEVIDEVLKDTNQTVTSSHNNRLSATSVASESTRKLTPSPSPRYLGRETKYAHFQHQPPTHTKKTLTKPGVIRPVMVMSRLDDNEKSCLLNAYQRQQDSFSPDHQYKLASRMSSPKDEAHGRGDLEGGRDSSEVPETCMSSSTHKMNQAREHGTPSPRGTSL